MICLDTNVAVAAMNFRPPQVRTRLQEALASGAPAGLPAIASFELRYGIAKSVFCRNPRPRQKRRAFRHASDG